ncbi:MAG: RNA polymerase factor sigma-32 [Roseinatronobacter sp.]
MPLDIQEDRRTARLAMKAEMLDAETEWALARAWRDQRDEQALHRLINAYMRLAVSLASKYRRYGMPMNDLIQEAGMGLMKAANKFDPDRELRFSTYASWWIRASLQEYLMRNWSMVRVGSTSNQKSLFFNYKRVKAKFEREALARGEEINSAEIRKSVASELNIPLQDVEFMDGRLAGSDFSLNALQTQDEDGREWIDALEDDAVQAEAKVEHAHDRAQLREWLLHAMASLSERERFIVRERMLIEEPRTLESLGEELNLSKERVRQIQVVAFQKMRTRLQGRSEEMMSILA